MESAAEEKAQDRSRRLLKSVWAILGAWIAVMGSALILSFLQSRTGGDAHWKEWVLVFYISGFFVVGAWLLVVLPLFWFVARHAVFWRWPVSTGVGALAGGILFYAILPTLLNEREFLLPGLAVLIGALTGLFASRLTR